MDESAPRFLSEEEFRKQGFSYVPCAPVGALLW